MGKFEQVGKQHIIEQISTLEAARPGWLPMFYFTLTFEGDIRAATALREAYDMPRPSEVDAQISMAKTKHVERLAIAQAESDHHDHMMQTDWIYWACRKLGFNSKEAE
jgi:hypothetical protein